MEIRRPYSSAWLLNWSVFIMRHNLTLLTCEEKRLTQSFQRLALHQNVLKTGGPIYFASSQSIPLYLAFWLYFYTTSLSANIKELDLPTSRSWLFWDINMSSQWASILNKVIFLATTHLLQFIGLSCDEQRGLWLNSTRIISSDTALAMMNLLQTKREGLWGSKVNRATSL